MVERHNATARLAEAIPDAVISLLNQGASASADDVRVALATIFSVLTLVFFMRVSLGMLAGLRDLMSGASHVVRLSGFWAFVAKLAALGMIAWPIYQLMEVLHGTALPQDHEVQAVLCGLLWLCLRAAVRDKVWCNVDERTVNIRSGFAIFSVTETKLNMAQLLIDATARTPVGAEVTGRPVHVKRAAFKQIKAAFGDADTATEWLRGVILSMGLVPAGRLFVAGNSAD